MRRVFYAFKHVILQTTRQNVVCTNDNFCPSNFPFTVPESTADACSEYRKFVFFSRAQNNPEGVSNSEVALRLLFGRCSLKRQANHANGYHAELVL